MREAVDRFRLTGLSAAVAASVSPLPASGAGPAIWTVAERDDGCAVEHYPDGPEGGLQFSLLRQADTGYSMSGLAFERYTETGERPQRIEVTADGRMILLLGPPYEMGQQARRWASSHPVDEFFAIASGANEFTVAVDGKKTTVSLAGFAAVRTEYDACIERMATIGPNAPVLIEFNGMNQLAAEAGRQRMLSQKLGYTLTIDAKGNIFSATPSDTSSDAPVIPGLGFVPSSRGSQSRPDPDHPASILPGKRPRLTPNPAIAIRPGEWALPLGTPGADVQCQAMAQTLLNIDVFAMNPQQAVEAPRFASYSFPQSFAPHAYHPGLLKLEGRIDPDVGAALAVLGHKIEWWGDWEWMAGAMCTIRRDLKTGVLEAGADPRRSGYALGW